MSGQRRCALALSADIRELLDEHALRRGDVLAALGVRENSRASLSQGRLTCQPAEVFVVVGEDHIHARSRTSRQHGWLL